MSIITNNNRFNDEEARLAALKQAENKLLKGLGVELANGKDIEVKEIKLLEGNKDYNFLYNFLPDTEVHRQNLSLNFETDDLNTLVDENTAKINATKEYYLNKAIELDKFWGEIPNTEKQHQITKLHNAKRFRLSKIVRLLNQEIAFNKKISRQIKNRDLNSAQQHQIKSSLKKIDKQRTIAQEDYLNNDIKDLRIPLFDKEMTLSESRINKEMFLITEISLRQKNADFYKSYNQTIDSHIRFQGAAKRTHESGHKELSKLYGYMSQYSMNLKEDFLDLFKDKLDNKTINRKNLKESLTFFENNFAAMTERLLPSMVEAIKQGTSFKELMSTKTDAVSEGFDSLKEEFDSIYEGLIEHAEGKKTIADLMRQKAYKLSDMHANQQVTTLELSQNIIDSREALVSQDLNYDLDNDGDVDNKDIRALNDVLKSKNKQFDRYVDTINRFDINQDSKLGREEALKMLQGFSQAQESTDLNYDLNGDNKIDQKDYKVIETIIKSDLGLDFTKVKESSDLVKNILDFSQEQAKRKLELWDLQDTKLDEYKDSAGETYGIRRQYYQRYKMAKAANSHLNLGGSYIDQMISSIAKNSEWLNDNDATRNTSFNDRLEKLNNALNTSMEVHKKAAEKPEKNGWHGTFASSEESTEARIMASLNVQREKAATQAIFFSDADSNTVDQLDSLHDMLELSYSDYYNNIHGWDTAVNEGNKLADQVQANPDGVKNRDAADFAMSTATAIRELITGSRYQAKDLSNEEDAIYSKALDEYKNIYLDIRDKIKSGLSFSSAQMEEYQDMIANKHDFLMKLGNQDENTLETISIIDTDNDGIISDEERNTVLQDFDAALRLEQILKTNDFAITEESQAVIDKYDINDDGIINELDYDLIDNAVGYNNEFPIHNLMNIINKQEELKEYIVGLNEINNPRSEEILEFLNSEIDFDKDQQSDYYSKTFTNNGAFKTSYSNIETLRLEIIQKIENSEDASDLIAKLDEEKEKLNLTQTTSTQVTNQVEYLSFLDTLENKNGVLVDKYLNEPEFFTANVKEALVYISESDLDKAALVENLLNSPADFDITLSNLKAAETLELTEQYEKIASGEINSDQANFLEIVAKHTDSKEFLADDAKNDLLIGKVADGVFGDGSFDATGLSQEELDYADMMIDYSKTSIKTDINENAEVFVDEMTSILFSNTSIAKLTETEAINTDTFTVSRPETNSSSSISVGLNPNSSALTGFYSNVRKVFNTQSLESIQDLVARHNLLTQLDLQKEASEANKKIMEEYLKQQIEGQLEEIEAKKLEVEELSTSRFNKFKVNNINKEIRSLSRELISKTSLMALFQ